jgi:CubicO group peptidase (beta-lactamase class C family)
MLSRFRFWRWLVIVLFLLAALVVAPTLAQEDVYFPTAEWRTSTPEEQGMDSAALAEYIEKILKLTNLDSLMIVRNGYVVAEVYWHPFTKDLKHELQSVSKSVTSALVGIAIDQGFIQGIDQKVLDFFPEIEPKNLDDNKRAMTIRDLLTETSGFNCDITQGTDPQVEFLTEPHITQYILDWRMADAPGTTWRHCEINAYLLSAIISRTTGQEMLAFARQNLFAPLGITDVDWSPSTEGIALGIGGLRLNTQDMAKIGYLYLNNGRWGESQIVPADWVKESTQDYAPQHPWGVASAGYGYLWYLSHVPSDDFFDAVGSYFQHIHVVPDKNLVVANTGADNTFLIENLFRPGFMEAILKTVKSDEPLPPNPDGVARLEAAAKAAASPEAAAPKPLPPLAAEISGHLYRLDEAADLQLPDIDYLQLPDEDWKMAVLGLDFGQDEATLHLQSSSGKDLTIPVGLDGNYRVTTNYLGTVAARGQWINETVFALDLRRLEQGTVMQYNLTFKDDQLRGSARRARAGEISPYTRFTGQLMP